MERIAKALNRRGIRTTKYGKSDFWLVLFASMLIIFGLIMIFSASYYWSISENGTPYYFLIKHFEWILIGVVFFVAGSRIDYHTWGRFKYPIVAVSIILLILLLIPGVGKTINYATRWIQIGPITIMPGEIAKICGIIFTATFISEEPGKINSFIRGVCPILLLGAIYAGLIIKQPNLSTAITVLGIIGCMLIVAGLHKKYIAGAFALAGAGFLALVTVLRHTYWYTRFETALNPFADPLGQGYQVVQSLYALGSGGLTGLGLGKSVQKNLYLPEPQNDFILAIIGEELGLLGIMALFILYCAFLWRGVLIALRAKDQLGMLLASGVVLMVGIQVVLNVAVVTASMPATGINLPFISYGGNAILIFMFATGILVNVSRQSLAQKPKVAEPKVSEREKK